MERMLLPSLMCLSPRDLETALRLFEKNGIPALHVDVMDGHFVPNLQLGVSYCQYLREMTKLPLDYHLMVEDPARMLEWFPIREGDWVSVHVETDRHIARTLARIRDLGAHPMVALNPATPLCMAEECFPLVDGVLLMTVNPGFAGQKLVPSTIGKICRLRAMLDEGGYGDLRIETDGNVSEENLLRMRNSGADMFVIGTSGFLNTRDPREMEAGIQHFQSLIWPETDAPESAVGPLKEMAERNARIRRERTEAQELREQKKRAAEKRADKAEGEEQTS